MNTTFGMRLKNLRENLNLTQNDIAKKLNCSYKMISNYELDKRSPDFEMLIKLSNIFDVTCDYLLGASNNPKYFKQSALTDKQIQLLDTFNKLPDKHQDDIIRFAKLNLLDININGCQ